MKNGLNFGMNARQMSSNIPFADRSGANNSLNALRSRIGLLDLTYGRLAETLAKSTRTQAQLIGKLTRKYRQLMPNSLTLSATNKSEKLIGLRNISTTRVIT